MIIIVEENVNWNVAKIYSIFISVGSLKFVFKVDANVALVLAVLPPTIYMALCFYLGHSQSDKQIKIAAFMSILYAFLMTATILSVIGEYTQLQLCLLH